MKRRTYNLRLSEGQLELITTALSEWSLIEYETNTGKPIARALRDVRSSIIRQMVREDKKRKEEKR